MTLEEYVLTYRDSEGKIVCNIADYFEEYIKPLNPKFRNSSFHTHRTVICCFKNHDDINPSLGTVPHRHLKGVRVYHCFGCGAKGTVIRLHQRIQKEYFGRSLTDKEAALDLCKLYGIDTKLYDEVKDAGAQNGYLDRCRRAEAAMNEYSVFEFRDDLMKVRQSDDRLLAEKARDINSAIVKMIATSKRLID